MGTAHFFFRLLFPFVLSFFFLFLFLFTFFSTPLPFLLIYSLNHALVLMRYNTEISHTKCYSCPAWLDFLPVPVNKAAPCKKKIENPYTYLFSSWTSRRQNNCSPGSLLKGLCLEYTLDFPELRVFPTQNHVKPLKWIWQNSLLSNFPLQSLRKFSYTPL